MHAVPVERLIGQSVGDRKVKMQPQLHAHYPATIFGSVNGKVSWWVNLAQALTPFGMGWLFTQFGSYLPSLLLLSVLATLAAVAAQRLTSRTENVPAC